MVVTVQQARRGLAETPGLPVRLSDTPGAVLTGMPVYGQHTREIRLKHGFTDAEIDALAAEGAIVVVDLT